MSRRTRSSHGVTLDMTSLLDVVFIVLFIVVMAYAQIGNNKIVDDTDKENAVQAYIDAASKYDELLSKVELITVTCTYSHSSPENRSLTILSDGVVEPKYSVHFTDKNEDLIFNQVRSQLNGIVAENAHKIYFIECNDENIRDDDWRRITSIISELRDKYPESIRG